MAITMRQSARATVGIIVAALSSLSAFGDSCTADVAATSHKVFEDPALDLDKVKIEFLARARNCSYGKLCTVRFRYRVHFGTPSGDWGSSDSGGAAEDVLLVSSDGGNEGKYIQSTHTIFERGCREEGELCHVRRIQIMDETCWMR